MAQTAPYLTRHEVIRDPAVVHWDDVMLLVARLAFVALFLPSGIRKLMGFQDFSSHLAALEVWPGYTIVYPEVLAAVVIAIELVGSLMLLFGFGTRVAALALAAFVAVSAVTAHRYWEYQPPERQAQEINFYKNAAIAGGLLALVAAGAGAVSTEGRRRLRVVREDRVVREPDRVRGATP